MGYIMDLRKLVGKRPLLVVACGVFLFNENGQILLQKEPMTELGAFLQAVLNLVKPPKKPHVENSWKKRALPSVN